MYLLTFWHFKGKVFLRKHSQKVIILNSVMVKRGSKGSSRYLLKSLQTEHCVGHNMRQCKCLPLKNYVVNWERRRHESDDNGSWVDQHIRNNNCQNDVGMPRHKEAISCETGKRGDFSTETDLKPSSKWEGLWLARVGHSAQRKWTFKGITALVLGGSKRIQVGFIRVLIRVF